MDPFHNQEMLHPNERGVRVARLGYRCKLPAAALELAGDLSIFRWIDLIINCFVISIVSVCCFYFHVFFQVVERWILNQV